MARIILADDDELIGDLVRGILESRGHIVGLVSNGADALKAVWVKRPDLMILDCNMPDVSGVNVLRELRRSPELYRMPVLMLTARRSRTDEAIAMYEGANGYLKKPFGAGELIDSVESILAKTVRVNRALPIRPDRGVWGQAAGAARPRVRTA